MTTFRDLMPSVRGYAQFGYKKPVFERNALQKSPHTWGKLAAWTSSSTSSSAYLRESINTGSNWTAVTWGKKDSSSTTTDDIPLNRLWNTLQGSTTAGYEQAIGFNHDINPFGTQEWENTKNSIRVRKCKMHLQVHATAETPVECLLLVWRSDAPAVETGFDANASSREDYASGSHDTPGAIQWTCSAYNPLSAPSEKQRKGFKSFEFYIPQYFNDVEWLNDSPNTGGTGTNFWVDRNAANLFTDAPNLQLYAKLFVRMPIAGGDAQGNVSVELQQHWDVELHTGDEILVSPAGAAA